LLPFTQRLAYRQLRAPQKGSFVPFAGGLAVAGLCIGVAALILTFSALEGFEKTVSSKIAGFDGHIRIQHYFNQSFSESSFGLDSIHDPINVPYSSYTYVEAPVLVRKGEKAEGALVTGINEDNAHQLKNILVSGTIQLENGSVILGDRLAELLSVNIGDMLVLVDFNSFNYLGSPTRLRSFRVQGLFHSGLFEYDKSMIYMPLKDAQTLFGLDEQVHGEVYFVPELKYFNSLEKTLDSSIEYPLYTSSWMDKHQILFDWMNLQKWPILAIFGMIAFVGLVNIMSALTMIVLEKIRESGILLALGYNKRSIRNLFVLEGIIIGFLGTALGFLLAVGIMQIQETFQILKIPEDIYFMDRIPMQLNLISLAWIISGSILSAIIAALLPALKAKNIKPAEALRYE